MSHSKIPMVIKKNYNYCKKLIFYKLYALKKFKTACKNVKNKSFRITKAPRYREAI